jgi:hypothetical protein
VTEVGGVAVIDDLGYAHLVGTEARLDAAATVIPSLYKGFIYALAIYSSAEAPAVTY